MEHVKILAPRRRWRRRILTQILAVLAVILVFVGLYVVARGAVLNEIRRQAMGVAAATAAGISPDLLESIRVESDMQSSAYAEIQGFLDSVSRYNPDVRYVYTMRRSKAPEAKPTDYVFIVDQTPTDDNSDGTISDDEGSEAVGASYDASEFPALVEAWTRPSADEDVSADPPYPDLISGYAPIFAKNGSTVGIVGVDITATTVGSKLFYVRLGCAVACLLSILVLFIVLQLVFDQRNLLDERSRLISELQEAAANVTTLGGLLPICSSCKRIRNDQGYWEQLEQFFSEKANTEFTHSVCPECMKRHYPEAVEHAHERS